MALALPAQAATVVHDPGSVTLANSGKILSGQEYRSIKAEQRTGQNYWKSEWAFPSGDVFERESLLRARSFVCLGMHGCRVGDCCSRVESHDVFELRRRVAARASNIPSGRHGRARESAVLDVVHSDLAPVWDGENFGTVNLQLSKYVTIKICPASYAFLAGLKGSSAQTVIQRIKDDVPPPASVPQEKEHESAEEQSKRKSLEYGMLERYVSSQVMNSHEQNPAPGAHHQKQTVVNTSSWEEKWQTCCYFFQQSHHGQNVGSKSMLKKVWRAEKLLKERLASSHSKCDICSDLDKKLERLNGIQGDAAKRERGFLLRAKKEHEQIHLGCRAVFDDYGFQALVNPSAVWCICCDAMTAKTVELPRFNSRKYRLPKAAAGTLPKWGFKLTATYCFGYGFIPFISHDALEHGPNLVWTVIWESICRLRRHHGNYPDVLFILLDNTTGENKTNIMFAMGAWLVATGRVKQVRIFFLMVGHTHIIIDQIFGVVSVSLRGKEILLPQQLISTIDGSLAKKPSYMAQPVTWLRCLYDFWDWSKQMDMPNGVAEGAFKRQGLADEEGTYNGMYDFVFNPDKEQLALMQYRERHDYELRPEGEKGVPVIRKLPTGPPRLAKIASYEKWGKIKNRTIRDTVDVYLDWSRTIRTVQETQWYKAEWEKHITDIPSIVELLPPGHKLVFQDFAWTPNVPLLTHRPAAGAGREQEKEQESNSTGNASQDDEDSEYNVWRKVFFSGVRNTPFAYDPVTSKVQPASVFNAKGPPTRRRCSEEWAPRQATNHSSWVEGSSFLVVTSPSRSTWQKLRTSERERRRVLPMFL